jgi:SAM-dependent methyltransferase
MYALDVLYGLWEPIVFLGLSAAYLPSTFAQIFRQREWGALASFDQFSYIWFANLWSFAGPVVREGAEARVVPLLQGRVRAGAIVPPNDDGTPLPAGVGGTVIEIGPGSGNWVNIFSDQYLVDHAGSKGNGGYRTRVDKVYGIEPNADHHTTLRKRIRDSGLEGRYEVVPVGIQDIGTSGLIEKGSVDAIVTVMCLCSIPEPEKNIRELYTYLKPGGRWFVYEHVVCHRSQGTFMSLYQRESTASGCSH